VRHAGVSDADSIASVHVKSWKTTYKGILPDSVLDSLSEEKRGQYWRTILTESRDTPLVLVGCDETGKVVGFACGGHERTREVNADGELYAIYLLENVQRGGLGSALVQRLAIELRSLSFHSMAVWVLSVNPARKFYEAVGGKLTAEKQIEIGSELFQEVAYVWDDLDSLLTRVTENRSLRLGIGGSDTPGGAKPPASD
jgi:GNAT superfamily N-acetyltransferase